MQSTTVETASPSDVPLLLDMMHEFNRAEQMAFSREATEPALRRLLASPDLGQVGRIVDGGATIGYFVLTWGFDLEWNGRDAFLTELYLEPGARGCGFGKAAIKAIEAIARGAGARALHLMVREENTAAVRLYRGAGFESTPLTFLTKSFAVDSEHELASAADRCA